MESLYRTIYVFSIYMLVNFMNLGAFPITNVATPIALPLGYRLQDFPATPKQFPSTFRRSYIQLRHQLQP
jgi:hypothetical protein